MNHGPWYQKEYWLVGDAIYLALQVGGVPLLHGEVRWNDVVEIRTWVKIIFLDISGWVIWGLFLCFILSLLFFFNLFIVHALSALDRDMDVYTTLQKPGLCPRSKATAQNWWTATFTIYKMVAHMSPRSWSAGPSPGLQRRPSTHLGSHWHRAVFAK